MLAPVTWLSPVAKDALRSISKLLRGEVPCPAAKLATLLKDKSCDSQCEGLLSDPDVRAEFAKKLEASKLEVTDANAVAIVDLLGSALEAKLAPIKMKATIMAKVLPKAMPETFKDLEAAVPKGTVVGDHVKKDWIVWNSIGTKFDAKAMPALESSVLCDRIATLLACGKPGPFTDCALAMHTLDNIAAYISWEQGMPMPGGKASSKEQFDKSSANICAIRKALTICLPLDVATEVASKVAAVGGSSSPKSSPKKAAKPAADTSASPLKALEAVSASAKVGVVIPFYTAPPAPKDPKDAGDKKAAKENKGAPEKGAGGKEKGAANGPAGAGLPAGLDGYKTATATQELQWHLMRYRMFPTTSLSAGTVEPLKTGQSSGGGGGGGGGGGAAGKKGGGGGGGGPARPVPQGFQGVFAPPQEDVPPGHTQYTWGQAVDPGCIYDFRTTWRADVGAVPPGHTDGTWVEPNCGSSKSSSSPKKPKKEEKKAAAAPAGAAAKGGAAAAPAAGGKAAPEEGTVEAAAVKLDLRCGLTTEVSKVADSDKLFLVQIDVGGETKQVVTGLQAHYKTEELKNRLVVVYCNIKPGKLAGQESQAMILCSSSAKDSANGFCKLLEPPKGTKPGTRALCGDLEFGSHSAGVSSKNIHKQWQQVQPLLLTDKKSVACFNGAQITMGGKPVTADKAPEGQIS